MKCVLDLEEKVFQVTVKDTGVGIENVEKAMEPMFTTCPELERSGDGDFRLGRRLWMCWK